MDTGEDTNAANVHSHTAIRTVKVFTTKLGVKDVLSKSERNKEVEGECKEGVLGGGEEETEESGREKARVGRKAEEEFRQGMKEERGGLESFASDWPGIEGAPADVDSETKEDNTGNSCPSST